MRWALLLWGVAAAAHDLQVALERSGPAVIARAAYAGTEPCAYASVLVYAPGESKIEHQNGRTDANGVFAFVPDRSGAWRLVVDDEFGHRKELTVEAQAGGVSPATAAEQPLWRKMLTGVSLILGLTGFLYGWKARRANRGA